MPYPKAAVDESYLLLPQKLDSIFARRQQAAIGWQESKYLTRVQYGGGPAHSYWQQEEAGGIHGVMNFKADGGKIAAMARSVCHARGVPFVRHDVWKAMATDDVLGAAFCRLLMYTDAYSVPKNIHDGWSMYLRTWRPGKPHPEEWPASWAFGQGVA